MKNNLLSKSLVIGSIFLVAGTCVVSSIDSNIDSDTEIVNNGLKENTLYVNKGLVGYWSFDFETAEDESGNNNHGSVEGAIPVYGMSGCAFSFDGVNDYIEFGADPDFDITGDIAISLWFKTDTSQVGVLINKVDTINPDNGYCLVMDDMWWTPAGTISFKMAKDSIGVNDWDRATTDSTFTDDNWHFLTALYTPDGSSRPKIYIDAVEQSVSYSGTPRYSIGASPGFHFKIGDYSHPGGYYNFDGTIDEVRVYNRALNEDEIQELYNNPAELKTTLMFGRIHNLNIDVGNLMTFNALKIRCIKFSPFEFKKYSSGEKIKISENYKGLLTPGFVFGIFKAKI